MTNSATSTERHDKPAPGFQAWHFFVLLSMAGATAAVMVSRETHPAALLLLSAAVICAGLVGIALTKAVAGFFQQGAEAEPLAPQARDELLREKALVLRSIKELEFDRSMKKVSEEDFAAISSRLRARAMALIQELERATPPPAATKATRSEKLVTATCGSCGTQNDADAKFCKQCGSALRDKGRS